MLIKYEATQWWIESEAAATPSSICFTDLLIMNHRHTETCAFLMENIFFKQKSDQLNMSILVFTEY